MAQPNLVLILVDDMGFSDIGCYGGEIDTLPKGAKNKKAAPAFARWFLSQSAQVAYGKAGGIPVRSDVLSSDLAKYPMNRWMPAYLEALKTAKQELGYQEGAQVEAVLGLKLNQALIGELNSVMISAPTGRRRPGS